MGTIDISQAVGMIALFSGLTVFFLWYAMKAPVTNRSEFKDWDAELLKDSLQDEYEPAEGFGKYARPILDNFLPQLPQVFLSEKNETKLRNLIKKSGNPWRLDRTEEFVAICIAMSILGALIGLSLTALGVIPETIPAPVLVIALAGMGAALPYSAYNSKKEERTKAIEKQLPEALDLLTITIHSGMTFETALETVTRQLPEGLVRDQFYRVVTELQSGATLRNTLLAFNDRFESEDLDSFVKAILQTTELGSSPTETLDQQSAFIRANYEARLNRMIARMETTIFIPVTGLMLPAFIIIFAGPALDNIMAYIG